MAEKPSAVSAGDTATATQYNNLCDYAEDILKEYAPGDRISIWTGTIANIPSGWYLCDGNNGTPNLLDRFLQMVPTAATEAGSTGGADDKTTDGHYHDQLTGDEHDDADSSGEYAMAGGATPGRNAALAIYSTSGGADTRSIMLTGVTEETDGVTDIRPKYYEVIFIMAPSE